MIPWGCHVTVPVNRDDSKQENTMARGDAKAVKGLSLKQGAARSMGAKSKSARGTGAG